MSGRPAMPSHPAAPMDTPTHQPDFRAFAPVARSEAVVAGALPARDVTASAPATPPAPAPVVEASVAPPAPPPAPAPAPIPGVTVPRFVGGGLRAMTVPLRYPVEFAGRVWDEIPLRRPTAREVGEYFEALQKIGAEEWLHFPIYADADGTPVPGEVIDFLDPDDSEAVSEASADFLCDRLRRFEALLREKASTP